MALTEQDEIISERIHDTDSSQNEKMVHWLHFFIMGKVTLNEIQEQFHTAYVEQDLISFPWDK
jgi:hypothetical protein